MKNVHNRISTILINQFHIVSSFHNKSRSKNCTVKIRKELQVKNEFVIRQILMSFPFLLFLFLDFS